MIGWPGDGLFVWWVWYDLRLLTTVFVILCKVLLYLLSTCFIFILLLIKLYCIYTTHERQVGGHRRPDSVMVL